MEARDRVLARAVTWHFSGGASGPQVVGMCLFAFAERVNRPPPAGQVDGTERAKAAR